MNKTTTLPAVSLAVDELMRSPEFPTIVDQILKSLPANLLDHLGDIGSAAHNHMAAAGQPNGLIADQVPEWLRLGALDALAQHVSGTARTCEHHPGSLDPVWAVAWKPDLVVCHRRPCGNLLRSIPGTAEDVTCDRCGHVTDTEAGELITIVVLAVGGLVYKAGVCAGCVPAWGGGGGR